MEYIYLTSFCIWQFSSMFDYKQQKMVWLHHPLNLMVDYFSMFLILHHNNIGRSDDYIPVRYENRFSKDDRNDIDHHYYI